MANISSKTYEIILTMCLTFALTMVVLYVSKKVQESYDAQAISNATLSDLRDLTVELELGLSDLDRSILETNFLCQGGGKNKQRQGFWSMSAERQAPSQSTICMEAIIELLSKYYVDKPCPSN